MIIPRRYTLEGHTPTEHAIRNAVVAVEQLPPDERLTRAVILLQQAKGLVSDFEDERLAAPETTP